ncbi:tRNA (adenosine(37)-N6)-dimethylallyltransferase MiaA [Muriicola sp.]|uniref:tRNA (adenosine(37)-N6)-dimethylallyltransferase MiaA n=1 Tax=Muriicola sp. TaxID=2020856 RepID=UPI003C7236A9
MALKTLLVVAGATGIGKTALAIKLALHYETEILSADSRQFFAEMNIGTAVPAPEELQMVPHHFIQHKNIQEPYSVGDFERDALALLEQLFKVHDLVIMVGGSGLYIDAVLYGMDSFPKIDPSVREALNKDLELQGLGSLQEELTNADPDYAQKVDIQNPQRVLRALEVWRASGKPYSSYLGRKKNARSFNAVIVGIDAERAVIYKRINERVDKMMEAGLLTEVESLKEYKDLNALQTVGYKELFKHVEGHCTLEQAVEEIKKNSRRFAKRQGTWFRKNKSIVWVPHNMPFNLILERIAQEMNKNR